MEFYYFMHYSYMSAVVRLSLFPVFDFFVNFDFL